MSYQSINTSIIVLLSAVSFGCGGSSTTDTQTADDVEDVDEAKMDALEEEYEAEEQEAEAEEERFEAEEEEFDESE